MPKSEFSYILWCQLILFLCLCSWNPITNSMKKYYWRQIDMGLEQWNTYLARITSHPGDDILVYPLYAISNIHWPFVIYLVLLSPLFANDSCQRTWRCRCVVKEKYGVDASASSPVYALRGFTISFLPYSIGYEAVPWFGVHEGIGSGC